MQPEQNVLIKFECFFKMDPNFKLQTPSLKFENVKQKLSES